MQAASANLFKDIVDREDGGWVEPSSFGGWRQSNPRLHRAKATSAVSAWLDIISWDGGMIDASILVEMRWR